MVQPSEEPSTLMEQERMACAERVEEEAEEGVKLRVQEVLASTPVRGVLSMFPTTLVGKAEWLRLSS
jgi:hypothetical protein